MPPGGADQLLGDLVEALGGDSRADLGREGVVAGGQDRAGGGHRVELPGGLGDRAARAVCGGGHGAVPAGRRRRDVRDDLVMNLVRGPLPIDLAQEAAGAVVVDERGRLLIVDRQPVDDGRRAVVLALVEVALTPARGHGSPG